MNNLSICLSRLGPCALCGSIAGGGAGFVFGLTQFGLPTAPIPTHAAIAVGILLGFLAYLGILLFIGVLGNFGVRALLLPALITCLLAGLVTVVVVNRLDAQLFSTLIGWILGAIVGRLLCYSCSKLIVVKGAS